jgi:hypothetical protein
VSADGDTLAKLRVLITGLATLVSSNDPALNTVQEIVDRIKADELLINAKINTVDIVNALTSISTTKPLSAAQGKALKDALDTETTNRIAAGNNSNSSTNTTITNAIATEVIDRNAAISVETAARIAADALKSDIAAIVNVLTSTVTNVPLSAAQGKVLKDLLDLEVSNRISAVSAEVTVRNSAVSVIANGLTAEATARDAAIAVETANRTTADNTEIAARNTAITTAVSNLKGTVPADGDTLAKLRNLIAGLQTLVASDDISLDTIQELVFRIKSDEGLITSLTTNKINVTDIINALTSTAIDKPLSAAQGKVLKDLIDLEITNRTSAVNAEAIARANADALKIDKSAISNVLTNSTTTDVLSAAQGKVLKDALDAETTARISAVSNSTSGAAQLVAVQSARNFPLGTLISTSIDYSATNGTAWFMEIKGNAYQNALPFDISIQGYNYSDTILSLTGISNGKSITGMVALNVGGMLCFWFPSQQYWQGFTVMVTDVIPSGVPVNKVVSIGNTTKPAGTKEIAVIITQSWHSGNLDPQAVTVADTAETNARIAADAAEVTERNIAITSAITALKSGVATDGDTLAKLRTLISGLQTMLTSDDVNLDTIQEFVTRIKSDEGLISSLTTNKVNVSDIVNLLTSTAVDKPLSAAQGKVLKDALDAEVTARTALSVNKMPDIGNAVNLNTLIANGIYYQVSDAQASSGSNYPIPYAGKLVVSQQSNGFLWQEYIGYSGTNTRFFNRQLYNGVWSSWREVQYTDAPVTTVVPISNGGTGATTVFGALSALGIVPDQLATANTLLKRDANGDAMSRFVITSDTTVGSGVTAVMVKCGDNYHRSSNRAGLLTFLALTSTDIISALGYTPSSGTPVFAPGGVIEAGRYLDFHGTNSGTDFDVRLDASAGTGVNGAGTLTISASGGMSVNGPMGATVFNGNLAGNASTASSAAALTGPASVNGSDGWFRSNGVAGWFNSTYNVGIYSNAAGVVRTYNGASFVSEGTVTGTGGKIGRVRTDTIEWGSYGSISINGNTNGWGGIAFPDSALTLMMNNGLHGVFINNSGWLWQCDSAGNFTATANVTAYSDERLKENWRDLQADFVELWAGVKHGTYDKKKVSLLSPTQTYTGLSAQSVRKILPHTVLVDKEGILSLNYGAAAAVASVQLAMRAVEQDLKIQSLETLCSDLLERLIKLENK